MRRLLFTAILLASGLPLQAAEPCVTLDYKSVAAMFDDWNFALSSLDANQVTQRYWPDAVLLPTVSNTPRTNAAAIGDYFEHFLVKRPRGHIDTRTVQSGCNLAVDMGTYTFSLMDDKGTTSEVAARYTFVYQYRAGEWKILHHHSSAMPEVAASAVAEADAAKANAAPAKVVKSEPVLPLSRRERRAMRKEVVTPQAASTKPVEKPADVKASTEAKPATDAKPAVAKTPEQTKAAPDAKAAAAAKAPAAAAPVEQAPATDAKMPAEVRTAMFANLTASPAPAKFYPPEALRRKERGSVNLKVCTDGEGTVSESMEVLKSSGSKLLDEAAMTWAREVKWVPATFNRHRVEGCAKVDVSFEPPPSLADART